jgi:DNA-binding CsgD family transcriptional regulator
MRRAPETGILGRIAEAGARCCDPSRAAMTAASSDTPLCARGVGAGLAMGVVVDRRAGNVIWRMATMDARSDALAAGQAALERGAWEQARAAFERALAAEAGPEALEGLATAAWFLDEAPLVFDARERAYAGYRGAGRAMDAARVAIALAWDYRVFRGEAAVGDGWLARARRLLEGRGPTCERGWLLLREASFALPGDAALARERCVEARALGRELDDVDLEMTALALGGLVRVSQGEVAEGMAELDEATTAATAGEMRDHFAIGFSCCYLIFACERVRDFERAGQWCERLARMSMSWNDRRLLPVCRTHYGTVLVLRGEWARAEAELSEGAAGFAARPALAADALARLADLRWRQGRTQEATALLAQAEHHPLAVLCNAAIALERGDAADAVDGAARYLRQIGAGATERAPGLELLVAAHAQAGRPQDAAAAARELRAIADAAATAPLLGAARQAEGRLRLAERDPDGAREAFEDAVELLGGAGLPFETAWARVDLAGALWALGRGEAAGRELERARLGFAELGAAGGERRVAALQARRGAGGLSAREHEVLHLVAKGQTNAEIAAALVLSEHTVHRHVANILAKFGCSSRTAAVARATQEGLL